MPITSGSTPATAKERKASSGSMPSASALSRLITTSAAAPSLVCDELPAVTLPPLRKTGLSLPIASRVESARTPSSLSKENVASRRSPCSSTHTLRTSTGTVSSANFPSARAAAARWCERSPKASWSARLTP